jgi:hypothetical protein
MLGARTDPEANLFPLALGQLKVGSALDNPENNVWDTFTIKALQTFIILGPNKKN